MNRPAYINVGSPTAEFEPIIDVAEVSFSPRKTTYKVVFDEGYGRKEEREPTAKNLMHKYFPYYVIDEVVNSSNRYCMERKLREPHLQVWKYNYSAPITHSNIYHFNAIIYYMGICKLPCKTDYWSTYPLMPTHKITTMLGMTRDRFSFIWRHFHVQSNAASYQEEVSDSENDTKEDEQVEEHLVEQRMEKMQVEEEERNRDDSSVESDSSDEEGDEGDGNGKEGKVQEGIDGDGDAEHPHKNHEPACP
eukprot:1703884-Ditylum_brightwellii.AAC.1